MDRNPRRVTPTVLAALTALLAMACMPVATPLPTTIPISIPTSQVTSTNALTPTDTPIPPTHTPTPKPTKTPRPTKTPPLTSTPTPTPPPPPDIFRPVAPIDTDLLGSDMRLRASPDGTLWLITDKGIAKLVNGTWEVVLADYVGDLAGIDAAGRVWIVSEDTSEISAWDGAPSGDGGSWTVFGVDAGWIPLTSERPYVRDGQSDALGRPWFATPQDVRVFDGERWIVITPEDMGMEATSYEDCFPSLGLTVLKSIDQVWVSECVWCAIGPAGGSGVRWFDGHTWHGADSPVASGCVPMIEEDRSEHVWVGTSNILWRYDLASGNWTQFTPDISTAFLILDAVPEPAGNLWVSITLCRGSCFDNVDLYHVYTHDGTWVKVLEYEGFHRPTLILDAASTPWLFHEEIIYRIVEDVPEPVAHLVADNVVVDAAGRIWFVAKYEGQAWLWTLDIESR